MGAEALIAALVVVALGVLLQAPLRSWRRDSRRERAWRVRGTAGLRALAAEARRTRAARAQRTAPSFEQAVRAERERERAERELEEAAKEAERARAIDPDLSTESAELRVPTAAPTAPPSA